jgi:2-keto-4-pentenoate hydratase/2-oxohepta-3-ene-1,7-dioic acid hydratase in catechol pathway
VGHAQEIKGTLKNSSVIPKYPIYFSKIADSAIGNGDKIVLSKRYFD